ncbi:MAG: hypothetical protein LBD24_00175, partial [Spirochaetaceae bacterium]|nr:hypothetical protein [Spirochaetaceae bacterium]
GDGESAGGGLPAPAPSPPLSVKITGEVSARLLGYTDDFSSFSDFKKTTLGDVFEGKLNVSASAANAEAVINLRLAPVFDGSASPVALDQAYLRAFFGKWIIDGGLRKLTWGKADSFGPLDVVNPIDYTDLTSITDTHSRKIPRPLVSASYTFGAFTKLEGVFLPWFEGHRFARSGRWAPRQITEAADLIGRNVIAGLGQSTLLPAEQQAVLAHYQNLSASSFYPETTGMEYAQTGLRFTTTIRSSDVGFQYFFGNHFRPSITIGGIDDFARNPYGVEPVIDFSRYHQIGADYAQVVLGFNLRAELAAHITGDLAGDDGRVYNPSLWWSLGFDREFALFWGAWRLTLNLQVTEGIRVWYSRIGSRPETDGEAGAGATSTRVTVILGSKFFMDELECKVTGIWGVEDRDFFIIPGIFWTKGDVTAELSAGFLGGDRTGELGQYHKNSFIKAGLTYSF